MAINSREKGRRGEVELARILRSYGYDAYRVQQYCGANGDADVEGLPGIHIEVKRVQRLQVYDAMQQAKRDAPAGFIPAVFHRRNNQPWLVIMELTDWLEIYRAWEAQHDRTAHS